MNHVPTGECACGCGERTNVYKGTPRKFVLGHNSRGDLNPNAILGPEWAEQDRGYNSPCWVWQHGILQNGYGRAKSSDGRKLAHRVIFERFKGPVPAGLDLDHLCRNRRCVNPDHLEPVTRAENLRRGPRTKLTWEKVCEIRASDLPQRKLAEMYGVPASNICLIRNWKTWREAPAA